MKIAILEGHSKRCPSNPENLRKNFEKHEENDFQLFHGLDSFCEHNPVQMVLFVNGNFLYLKFHACNFPLYQYDKYVFLRKIIEDSVKIKRDSYNYYEVLGSKNLHDILRKNRLNGNAIPATFFEINYTYSNASGKEFCITTERNFVQMLDTLNSISEKRDKAVQWVNENVLESRFANTLVRRINELYEMNKPSNVSEYEVNKSVESFLKDIKNKIINE